jgi:hypothetical protein
MLPWGVKYVVEDGIALLECGGDTEADGGMKTWVGSWLVSRVALLIRSRFIVMDGRRN